MHALLTFLRLAAENESITIKSGGTFAAVLRVWVTLAVVVHRGASGHICEGKTQPVTGHQSSTPEKYSVSQETENTIL